MTELVAVGLNHKSAPVELRERLALPDEEHASALDRLRRESALSEVMILSTCNRVEVYGVVPNEAAAEHVLHALAQSRAVPIDELHGHVFVRASTDAARHIFRVAASLDSLVIGEPHVLGQVKDAFTRAKQSGLVGPVLDRCLSLAFKSAKRVRSETEIARGGASVPSVAVDLARSIFGDLSGSSVLIVGAGEMAELAAVHLKAGGASEIVVVNRSAERGQRLANEVGGLYRPWDALETQLVRADVVVTSTGAQRPVIDRGLLKPVLKARRQRPLFFVDIAVPRDVAADVGRMDHVFLYNVDDLQGLVQDNLRTRKGEADRAAVLVDEEVQGFLQWMRSRTIGPLMGQLQGYGRTIVDGEVEKVLAKLGPLPPEQKAAIEQLGRQVMQKLLHRPMTNVRKATSEPLAGFDGATLAEALAALFELDPEAAAESAPARPVAVESPPSTFGRGSHRVEASDLSSANAPTPIRNAENS